MSRLPLCLFFYHEASSPDFVKPHGHCWQPY
jgi:hypothetical protein